MAKYAITFSGKFQSRVIVEADSREEAEEWAAENVSDDEIRKAGKAFNFYQQDVAAL